VTAYDLSEPRKKLPQKLDNEGKDGTELKGYNLALRDHMSENRKSKTLHYGSPSTHPPFR
jgi:hypothetical protein